jgi:putative transposase
MCIVEIDTHMLDIIIIDKSTGEALGRPYLTLVIEIRTRVIVGIYIGMYPPSTITALAALKDMLTRPNRGLRGGICGSIIPDGGPEFINCGLEKVCATLHITILSSQAYEPNNKPHVESLFKTLTLGIIQKLAGTTFSNPEKRGDYDSTKNAVFDLITLNSLIHEWIEHIYHKSIHSMTKRMPLEHWDELAKETPIHHLSDTEAEALIRRPVERTINNGRILFDHIYYFSHALKTLENLGLKQVTILINDLDLNKVIVEHPTDEKTLIIAESTDPEYTSNLTRYEHNEAIKIKNEMSKSDLKKHGKYANLIALYQLMKRVHEESLNSKRQLKKLTNGAAKIGYAENKLKSLVSINEDNNADEKNDMKILESKDSSLKLDDKYLPEENYNFSSFYLGDEND